MKKKLMVFGAMLSLTGSAWRFIFDVMEDGIYSVPNGWCTKLVVLIWSMAIVLDSDLSLLEKFVMASTASVVFLGIVCFLATISYFGIIEVPV